LKVPIVASRACCSGEVGDRLVQCSITTAPPAGLAEAAGTALLVALPVGTADVVVASVAEAVVAAAVVVDAAAVVATVAAGA
jgi:hypothetical protein